MNNQEAKQILALFRPGTADQEDPFFGEARQLAKSDPELARWFDEHCEAYLVLRRKFQAIPIPPGLKVQILSERKIQRRLFQRDWRPLPQFRLRERYPAFRKRMTEMALRSYSMDLMATNPVQIRNFLKAKNAPADYSLPAGLQTAALAGCVVCSWQGSPVSMICFKSGRPLPPGDQSDLWLFVTDRETVAKAPAPGAPVFARVNKATTVSWSDGNKNYLLAAVGDEAFLRKYLQ
jgi:hypothetical protein